MQSSLMYTVSGKQALKRKVKPVRLRSCGHHLTTVKNVKMFTAPLMGKVTSAFKPSSPSGLSLKSHFLEHEAARNILIYSSLDGMLKSTTRLPSELNSLVHQGGERHCESKFKCLAQEHNSMSLAKT